MLRFVLLAALVVLLVMWWRGAWTRAKLMPLDEARALLDVGANDDAEAIRAAHRRLIARVHPDAGGSPELARRTNEARDVLLAHLSHRSPEDR